MRVKATGLALISLLLVLSLVVSACGKNDVNNDIKEGGQQGQNLPDGPFGKYDPPIELTMVRSIDATYKFAEGDSLDKNVWTDIFENELGIKTNNLWTVDAAQYRQKLNVTLASGELPDIMRVNKVELHRLQESGLIEDLTEAYEQFASPFVRSVMAYDGGFAMNSATFGGKLMALPELAGSNGVASSNLLFVRTDWLKKLGLPEPKTMDDVLKIAHAFATQDPDGNGKPDTFGIGINNELYSQSFGMLIGFLNGYHAYPNIWIKDESGKLVYGSVQTEMKVALKKLQELYMDGIIDREFSVKSWSKVAEDTGAGKIGLAYGKTFDPRDVLQISRTNDPTAEWRSYPIVSANEQPAVSQVLDTATNYYVVKKGIKYPEAIILLLNKYLNDFLDTKYEGGNNPFAYQSDTGIDPSYYPLVKMSPLDVSMKANQEVMHTLETNDASGLNWPASLHIPRIRDFEAGDESKWFSTGMFGPTGSYTVIQYYNDHDLVRYNEFYGAPTPTMVEKEATLRKMQDEVFTKIIMGSSIDEFDKFVNDWKKLGGEVFENEVNDWYKNK